MRLVYLSPVPWASFAQRPHRFVEWFQQRTGGPVLWIDPYPTRLPRWSDLRQRKSNSAQGQTVPSWLTVLSATCLPIEPLPYSAGVNAYYWRQLFEAIADFARPGDCQLGIGKPSALAGQILKRFSQLPSFYDAMDDFPAFYGGLSRLAMARRELQIVQSVDKLLVSSHCLQRRFHEYEKKTQLVLNACAANDLPSLALPVRTGRPILGYIGTISHWFDWTVVMALARQNPNALVRIVGPLHTPPPQALPSNVELQPACPHAHAMRLMSAFSIGLIPFKLTDLTASVDPIKYYEYRAQGLPVISTAFGEMAPRAKERGVFLVDSASDLQKRVETALAYRVTIEEIQAFREANTWEARFDAHPILVSRTPRYFSTAIKAEVEAC